MSFKERIEQARANAKAAQENMNNGGRRETPAGIYVAILEKFEPGHNKAGTKAQIVRDHRIIEGDNGGLIVRDWLGVETEVGVSIVCQFLQKQGFDIDPTADMFDWEKSEASQKMVFTKDFIDMCLQIEQAQPKHQIEVTKTQSADASRTFTNVKILKVLEESTVDAPSTPVTPVPAVPESAAATNDNTRKSFLVFCVAQGIEGITEKSTIDEMVEKVKDFEFPVVGVTKEQLIDLGYEEASIDLNSLITVDDAELLRSVGLGEIIVEADPKYSTPAHETKKRRGPPARK